MKNPVKIFFTLLAIIPLTVFCQQPDAKKTIKIAIGITFSPDYCYRTLIPNASSKPIADARDTLEIPRFGYTTGLNLAIKINKRITLETGILYSDKGEKTKTYTVDEIVPQGQINPFVPRKITFYYHYIYLDIPFKLNYYLLNNRTRIFLTAGISPNIFLTCKTKSTTEYKDGHTTTHTSTSSSDYRIFNLSIIAGAGLSYDLTSKLYFNIEPTYRRSITSIVDAPIKTYLYSIGLNTGLYYKL